MIDAKNRQVNEKKLKPGTLGSIGPTSFFLIIKCESEGYIVFDLQNTRVFFMMRGSILESSMLENSFGLHCPE